MEFNFSIRGALRDSWSLFKTHWQFFVGIAAVVALLNLVGGSKNIPDWASFILAVASFIWSIVMMKISLAAADGKVDLLSFGVIKGMLPSWRQALGMLCVGLFSGVLILGGLILLIIPGIYIAFRLGLANLSYIDRGEGIRKAVRHSWDITKGSVFWTTVLISLVALFLYIVGFILFGIGILVTYPIALILMAKFYRAVVAHHSGAQAIAPQPQEIKAPEPMEAPTTEEHHESENPAQ